MHKRKTMGKPEGDAHSAATETTHRDVLLVSRGTAGLAVAMGLGRFFCTPILPLMVGSLGWSGQSSAWIATSNYTGYFAGSLEAS
ncbi:hypothetical protein AY547_01360 [Corynebacterium diphtheriae bv. gravis]|uniref:YbfB/YjiJ family MFS transporter n=2 Tax=Corynebacterium diphtheriae TaxID=1717 RepID=A0AAX0IZW5_CORDP|nr:hypothetical protein CD31A_1390 [Corynebacterium diphtheriae 31A]AEX46585.1 hypothetical protein CDB402_1283 [Corynebacterium diphtheriae INCA 402]AEX67569.1 hypothetical protein CDC7B_1373 [Corynebacterium diphtheriae C7 (beta)]AEX72278.1 hypothetical protein CDCE8392_1285 [Corynebacterium diphtheriae CDCE 8392]APM35559.1 hypothetical protein BS112_02790 [Corynebacterium diphtheriae]KLN39711.1 hypothetical protein AL07_06585 [Corynebacterium diphtheriae bv. gravis str. ISS 4060]KLN41000.1